MCAVIFELWRLGGRTNPELAVGPEYTASGQEESTVVDEATSPETQRLVALSTTLNGTFYLQVAEWIFDPAITRRRLETGLRGVN